MHPLLQQIAERGMDQALALDSRLADEGGAFDQQAEMGFAGRIVAAMAAVLLAVVVERQNGRLQRRFEAPTHFGRNRSGASVCHPPYIEGFNGD